MPREINRDERTHLSTLNPRPGDVFSIDGGEMYAVIECLNMSTEPTIRVVNLEQEDRYGTEAAISEWMVHCIIHDEPVGRLVHPFVPRIDSPYPEPEDDL